MRGCLEALCGVALIVAFVLLVDRVYMILERANPPLAMAIAWLAAVGILLWICVVRRYRRNR